MSETNKIVAEMRKLIYGNWPMCVTYTFAELGLADLLIDKPRTIVELSALTGINIDYLSRFLKCCRAISFVKLSDSFVSLTHFGQLLSSSHPQSQRNAARLNGAAYRYGPWGDLISILRAGSAADFSPSFDNGTLAYLSDKPELLDVFDNAMRELSTTQDDTLAQAYDFNRFAHVVDIGSGTGSLLQKILQYHTQILGTMFDLKVNSHENNFNGRLHSVAGDFFKSIPVQGDLYIMKNVLHNWPMEKLELLLQNLKKTLLSCGNRTQKRVLIIEYLVNEEKPGIVDWLDLNFLVLVGGKDRSLREYDLLFQKFGFHRTNIIATSERSMIEYSF